MRRIVASLSVVTQSVSFPKDTLVLTVDLLSPIVRSLGVFNVSAAPRKQPRTVNLISRELGVSELEVRKFIHDNSFAFELMIAKERHLAVAECLSHGLIPRQIAVKLSAPLCAIYPIVHSVRALDARQPVVGITKTSSSKPRAALDTDMVIQAIIKANPFRCSDPPLYPSDRFIQTVCGHLNARSSRVYSVLISNGTDFPDLIARARTKVVSELLVDTTPDNLASTLSSKYAISPTRAQMNLRRYMVRE